MKATLAVILAGCAFLAVVGAWSGVAVGDQFRYLADWAWFVAVPGLLIGLTVLRRPATAAELVLVFIPAGYLWFIGLFLARYLLQAEGVFWLAGIGQAVWLIAARRAVLVAVRGGWRSLAAAHWTRPALLLVVFVTMLAVTAPETIGKPLPDRIRPGERINYFQEILFYVSNAVVFKNYPPPPTVPVAAGFPLREQLTESLYRAGTSDRTGIPLVTLYLRMNSVEYLGLLALQVFFLAGGLRFPARLLALLLLIPSSIFAADLGYLASFVRGPSAGFGTLFLLALVYLLGAPRAAGERSWAVTGLLLVLATAAIQAKVYLALLLLVWVGLLVIADRRRAGRWSRRLALVVAVVLVNAFAVKYLLLVGVRGGASLKPFALYYAMDSYSRQVIEMAGRGSRDGTPPVLPPRAERRAWRVGWLAFYTLATFGYFLPLAARWKTLAASERGPGLLLGLGALFALGFGNAYFFILTLPLGTVLAVTILVRDVAARRWAFPLAMTVLVAAAAVTFPTGAPGTDPSPRLTSFAGGSAVIKTDAHLAAAARWLRERTPPTAILAGREYALFTDPSVDYPHHLLYTALAERCLVLEGYRLRISEAQAAPRRAAMETLFLATDPAAVAAVAADYRIDYLIRDVARSGPDSRGLPFLERVYANPGYEIYRVARPAGGA